MCTLYPHPDAYRGVGSPIIFFPSFFTCHLPLNLLPDFFPWPLTTFPWPPSAAAAIIFFPLNHATWLLPLPLPLVPADRHSSFLIILPLFLHFKFCGGQLPCVTAGGLRAFFTKL